MEISCKKARIKITKVPITYTLRRQISSPPHPYSPLDQLPPLFLTLYQSLSTCIQLSQSPPHSLIQYLLFYRISEVKHWWLLYIVCVYPLVSNSPDQWSSPRALYVSNNKNPKNNNIHAQNPFSSINIYYPSTYHASSFLSVTSIMKNNFTISVLKYYWDDQQYHCI